MKEIYIKFFEYHHSLKMSILNIHIILFKINFHTEKQSNLLFFNDWKKKLTEFIEKYINCLIPGQKSFY